MTELRTRREPSPFQILEVSGTEAVSPRMTRVILGEVVTTRPRNPKRRSSLSRY
jgi:NADPH-dependent ferric siderophore reductase